ncbi:hypothetical protein VM1G_11479 [Cytospora mali]|uniref:Uncharacterized protein n=1 Tax=Cytospora mali TaxID=578113 RepID=A0A194VTU9_CYTMA|nr:hypothetical protein VM1G_11479 [Valsa mali]
MSLSPGGEARCRRRSAPAARRVGDTAVFLLLGVVGAVRYVPPQVPCDEFLATCILRCWGLRTLLEDLLLPLLPLPAVVVVACDAVLCCRWSECCPLNWLRGVLGLRLGASSSMSLSVSMDASSSRPVSTAGSSGCIVRRISANRCISSRNRALEMGRVE